jgi:hypothetical protein
MGTRSPIPPKPQPQACPDPPLSDIFLRLLSYLWEEGGGVGALPSDIGDIFLINIQRNEYYFYFCGLIKNIYPYLPGEYFLKNSIKSAKY